MHIITILYHNSIEDGNFAYKLQLLVSNMTKIDESLIKFSPEETKVEKKFKNRAFIL